MTGKGGLIVFLVILLAALTGAASAYVYASSQQTELAYEKNIEALSSLDHIDELFLTKTIRGDRTVTFDTLGDAQFPSDEFTYEIGYEFSQNEPTITVIDSTGQASEVEKEVVISNETILSHEDAWINLIDQEEAIISHIEGTTMITFDNGAEFSPDFREIIQENLIEEIQATFDGYSIDQAVLQADGNFDITIILSNNTIDSLLLETRTPVSLSYRLRLVDSASSSIDVSAINGTLEYNDLAIAYSVDQISFDPEMPTSPLELLLYSVFFY